ncbi:DUF833-domain-containing protein [Gonapodya prolifera JEL478]|uniref:DUF833-domain-containing protein n=1 Tax=Gonapodya prolifera (strain JEL478) TaxID=1344416 RepID=A0A138ZY48_GONPJ|nr:DUF833-domain-containing protein [Gonapodya prolifera JEL478]|eukprot:KXS09419.1 DUF833-domain-containing protein [Gonapodya prolifera JEL478]
MCIVFLSFGSKASGRGGLPLVMIANRDEFFSRPARPIHLWEDPSADSDSASRRPQTLAGKDLLAGGIWMGFDAASGRFGCVTNFPSHYARGRTVAIASDGPSRGNILHQWLTSSLSPRSWLKSELAPTALQYDGFSIFIGAVHRDGSASSDAVDSEAWHATNRGLATDANVTQTSSSTSLDNEPDIIVSPADSDPSTCCFVARKLSPGIVFGLSNADLDAPWPKTLFGVHLLDSALSALPQPPPTTTSLDAPLISDLFSILSHTTIPSPPPVPFPPDAPPSHGSIFIKSGGRYGTRASTVLVVDPEGAFAMEERRWDADGQGVGRMRFGGRVGERVEHISDESSRVRDESVSSVGANLEPAL